MDLYSRKDPSKTTTDHQQRTRSINCKSTQIHICFVSFTRGLVLLYQILIGICHPILAFTQIILIYVILLHRQKENNTTGGSSTVKVITNEESKKVMSENAHSQRLDPLSDQGNPLSNNNSLSKSPGKTVEPSKSADVSRAAIDNKGSFEGLPGKAQVF